MQKEHDFAQYVRILGKGKQGSRSLSYDEALSAFSMILDGSVEPVQLGAFLMLLRVKEETPGELAGFVTACRRSFAVAGSSINSVSVNLDWPSYAGKRSQQPWYLLSALLLADNNIRVLMHGDAGHTPGRLYSEQALMQLGITPASSLVQVADGLSTDGFAYLPLRVLCPPLHRIMQLKPLLGLRSPVNTLARLLNPLGADYSMQSVFHPAYSELHLAAEQLLEQPNGMVFKGEAGEVEIRPGATTRCLLQRKGKRESFDWPRSFPEKPAPAEHLDAAVLAAAWRGELLDPYGEAAVINTAAAALLLLEHANDCATAITLASHWWHERNREKF